MVDVPHHDFDNRILQHVRHRPWPMPDGPWIMTQTWHDLLFAHWPVDKTLLARKIPDGLELDLYEHDAWLGIVPFHMTNVTPRAVPALPWISSFPELNVRTYVRVGRRPGVFFFSLDAANRLAVLAARSLFHLPYYFASMQVGVEQGTVRYRSQRASTGRRKEGPDARLIATYAPEGEAFRPSEGSLEYFLTERYCLYTLDRRSRLRRLEIHHPPWLLQSARATFDVNTLTHPLGIRLPDRAPVLHFAKRHDVVAWPLGGAA